MAKLPHGKNPEKVADMAIRLLFPYRKNVLTITTDNGSEFACHKKIAKALGTTVQYIPKGTDFKELSENFIKEVQYKINRRPREKLNFSTPKREFFKLIS